MREKHRLMIKAGLHLDIYREICYKLGMEIETTLLHCSMLALII